ncbi:MAG: hypothetical protein KDI76_02685, partial [Xanthomonadales bacterium]|nr:hypothetical protein [Xanthomonadales bacterium]
MKKIISIALLLFGFSVIADDAKEQLYTATVTADLRGEKPQNETSTSIAILNSETIENAGTQHFEDIM